MTQDAKKPPWEGGSLDGFSWLANNRENTPQTYDLQARRRARYFDVRISAAQQRRPHGQVRLRLTEHQLGQLIRFAEGL